MGGSSGGGGRTPYEAPDSGRSKQRVRIVEVVSEGEVQGLVDGVKSVYLDNTPIQNQDGSYNFTNIQAEGRIGTQDQSVMKGFQATEKEISVGTEVRKKTAITRTVTDAQVSRLRLTLGVSSLFHQNDEGDTYGSEVDFIVTVGTRTYSFHISGKYSSQYLKNLMIDELPPVPFKIKVERVQEDSKSQRLQNKTIWASYTEIIDAEFAYPNTALVGIKFDSEYFSNIPTRSYEIYGIKIKVPSNYDPVTRAYTGLWDGTYKIAYSDNPAFILMDIVTNKRYGLGQRLGEFGVDKWALYQAAQYCDQMIPDGYGGTRPRFTCNAWITEQRSAYDVINDICSIFRAMPVWNGTELTVIMDRPSDPVWTYTNANVINGEFARQYSAVKARHNAIQVEYQDAANNYEKTIEYVSNDDDIRKYGLNLKKVAAFGCTNRGQAYCTGRWILETERLETETITFSVGAEGLMHIPGDIIKVSDNHYAGTEIGGRVVAVSGRNVTLDREIRLNGNSHLSYINAEAKHSDIKILSVKDNVVTLENDPVGLAEMGVWSLTTQTITSRLYRAMTVTENDNGSYTIVALQHEPQKEAIVDNGASFEPINTTNATAGLSKPNNINLQADGDGISLSFEYVAQNSAMVKYQIKLYKDGKFYKSYDDLTSPEIKFVGLPDGNYVAEIRAKNGHGQLSEPVSKSFSIQFAVSELVTVSKVFGIGLSWKNPIFANQNAAIEIWGSKENRFETARKLVSLAYPTNSYTYDGLGVAETYYFWARMVDNVNGTAGEFTPVTEGVTEQSAEKLVDYLEGQLTKDSFSQQLLDGLTQDIRHEIGENNKGIDSKLSQATDRLQQEVLARTAEIQRESQRQAQALQQEARERGTAITQLQNADRTHSQQISQATAKADQALSGVQAERTARIEANRAEVVAREALTGRVANAESGLTSLQRTVTQQGQSIAESTQQLNAKIDGISIGGRNLLQHSLKLEKLWNKSYSVSVLDGIAQIRSTGRLALITQENTPNLNQLSNGKVAISFDAKANRDASLHIRLRRKLEGNKLSDIAKYLTIASRDFKRYTLILDYQKLLEQIQLNFEIATYEPEGVIFDIRQPKLEIGNIATDWTPAPEDVEQSIIDVSADLTAYKSTQATTDASKAEQIARMATRLGQAESNLTRTENSLTTLEQTTNVALQDLRSRTQNAESSIQQVQDTKASKTEVASIARTALRSEWQSDAQIKADNAKNQAIAEANRLNQATSARIDTIANTLSTATQSTASEISTLRATVNGIEARADGLVKTEIDLTNLDQNTWYPVIFKGLKTGQTSRFRVSQNLISGLHNPTWASHGTRSFSLLCEWSANGGGWGAINVARVIHNFEFSWVSDRKSPIFTIDQMINSSTEYCRLRGGAKYDVFAPPNITVEKQPNGYSIQQQTISPFVNYYSDRLVPQSELKKLDASINENKQVVADVNGKVQAIHAFKVETISGGRKAVAGMTLGSNGGEQSEIILMADRLKLVRNAQDGSPVPMLGVINHNGRTRMALSGDIAVQGDLVGNRFVGGEIDITGASGILRVGRTGRFEMRASQHNRGLVINSEQILVYDEQGRLRVKIGKL
ncbi:hypothetical protein A1D29_07505 [Pasteurellaceae bacterium Orientalotternb1]|nr:hypothetical protein A1D29_07505 [Pasteurellaceae bacterium Orientalotternb1]